MRKKRITKREPWAHSARKSNTFEDAEKSTLPVGLETTFREKLEWLEEAETMILKMWESYEKMRKESKRSAKGNGKSASKR